MVKNFKNELSLDIPKEVTVKLEEKKVIIKGKLGTVTKNFDHIKDIEMSVDNNQFNLMAYFARKYTIAKMGTIRSHVQNAIYGVTKGFTYRMTIAYSHFPITLEPPKTKNGHDEILIKNFLGERSPRITYTAGSDVKITANKDGVVVSGVDKDAVAQTCANIQKKCRIRHKDSRIFQDGIYVYSKEFSTGEVLWNIK